MSFRRLQLVLAVLAVLYGLAHLSFLTVYPEWSVQALWFAGAGVAFVVTGLFNLAASRGQAPDRLAAATLFSANAAVVAYLIAAWTVAKLPQVAGGGVLFLALTAVGLAAGRVRQA